MILKIIGLCWMIGPVLIFVVPNSNVGDLLPYAATSFILGFLCFKAAPKHKKKTTDIVNPKRVDINIDKPLNTFSYSRKFENVDHERFVPKPSKLDEYQLNYSESIKLVENIGDDTYRSDGKKGVYDLIRNGKDYPGETSRISTESYFGVGYVKDDRIESMENLISFREAIYSYLGLNGNLPDNLAIDYCNNFPMVILCLAYFEIYNIPDKKEFFEKHQSLIYRIIETEHIKIAERMKKVPVVSKCSDIEIKRALNKISNSFLETKQTNGSSEYEIIKRKIEEELYQENHSASYEDQKINDFIRNGPESFGVDAKKSDENNEMLKDEKPIISKSQQFSKLEIHQSSISKRNNLLQYDNNGNIDFDIKDFIRKQKNFQGDLARVLTKKYYDECYLANNSLGSVVRLIKLRIASRDENDIEFDDSEILSIAEKYHKNIPFVLYFLIYLESFSNPSKKKFFIKYYSEIFDVVEEEYSAITGKLGHSVGAYHLGKERLIEIMEEASNMIKSSTFRGISNEQYIEAFVAKIEMELKKDILENEKIISDMPLLAGAIIDTSIENSVEILIGAVEMDMHNLELSKREIEELVINASKIVKMNHGIK